MIGLVIDRKGDHLAVADSKGKTIRVPKADIEVERVSDVSVMPERLLEQLSLNNSGTRSATCRGKKP
ncbi:MAG: hypothetical protein CM1200mP2_52150 [Planctomycetaceae bacterium]|nr:MAG: hypothetical protein CM1200mP2_52150 [Planctomycetaceae bacterium]